LRLHIKHPLSGNIAGQEENHKDTKTRGREDRPWAFGLFFGRQADPLPKAYQTPVAGGKDNSWVVQCTK